VRFDQDPYSSIDAGEILLARQSIELRLKDV